MGGSDKKVLPPGVVLLVEGNDEENFFAALRKKIGCDAISTFPLTGKYAFDIKLRTVKADPNFSKVTTLGIIHDADKDSQATFESICSALRKEGLPVPTAIGDIARTGNIRVGVYIMPGDLEAGMLEDLLLKSVEEDPAMECIEKVFECLAKKISSLPIGVPKTEGAIYMPSNMAKSRTQMFMATRHVSYPHVGIAAMNNVWKLDHACMKSISEFLMKLAK